LAQEVPGFGWYRACVIAMRCDRDVDLALPREGNGYGFVVVQFAG
jgi:hypothetical protein